MARLCDSCGPLKGGALTSRLHCHARHGDARATAVLVNRIMDSVCCPLYTMISKSVRPSIRAIHRLFFLLSVCGQMASAGRAE